MPRADHSATAVEVLGEVVEKQNKVLKTLTEGGLMYARFYRMVEIGGTTRADVIATGRLRNVALCADLDPNEFTSGERVLLDANGNVLIGHGGLDCGGVLAEFIARVSPHSLHVKVGEVAMEVSCPPVLGETEFRRGDLVRIDTENQVAFQRVPAAEEDQIESRFETTPLGPEAVAGQDKCLRRLLRVVSAGLDAGRAERYGLNSARSILLTGKPGVGKTLMARVAASELQRIAGGDSAAFLIRPAIWEHRFVGVGEALIRAFKRTVADAAKTKRAVLVIFEEVDTTSRTRGQQGNIHSDRYLGVWLAELDHLLQLPNLILIGTTNSVSRIDPALAERMAAIQIAVPRPANTRAARAIFGVHLPGRLLYSPGGAQAELTRTRMIDAAVARLWGASVATLHFRGATPDRNIGARELISGRLIRQICDDAKLAAMAAEPDRADAPGLEAADMAEAVENAIVRLRETLHAGNAREWLDLPEEQEVAAVTPLLPENEDPQLLN